MYCRYGPLGCTFRAYEAVDLVNHERGDHSEFTTPTSLYRFLGDFRRMQLQIIDRVSDEEAQPSSNVSDNKERELEASNTVSVPYRLEECAQIRVTEMRVFADGSDDQTFPDYLMDADHLHNHPAAFAHFRPLKYPSVVIENGIHNSLIMIRIHFHGNVEVNKKFIHFGLMNARGTYLRRMISQSRHCLDSIDPIDDTGLMTEVDDPLFRCLCYRPSGVNEYELYLQFRDTPNHMFEGHYRDLRVLVLCMSEDMSVIQSYDASSIFRVSPNRNYLPEKRVSCTVQELKWDSEWWFKKPEVPPMLGVHPTMRIEVTPTLSSKRLKRKNLLISPSGNVGGSVS